MGSSNGSLDCGIIKMKSGDESDDESLMTHTIGILSNLKVSCVSSNQIKQNKTIHKYYNVMDRPVRPQLPKGATETAWQKTVRKCKEEPLVPIGTLATTGCLMFGLKAFRDGKTRQSQHLMRARVAAQGFTILVICVGAALGMKPHNRPTSYEQKMENDKKEQSSQ